MGIVSRQGVGGEVESSTAGGRPPRPPPCAGTRAALAERIRGSARAAFRRCGNTAALARWSRAGCGTVVSCGRSHAGGGNFARRPRPADHPRHLMSVSWVCGDPA